MKSTPSNKYSPFSYCLTKESLANAEQFGTQM